MPRSPRQSSTRAETSFAESPICDGPNATSSSTLAVKSMLSLSWKMNPTRWCSRRLNSGSRMEAASTTRPSKRYVPTCGCTSPLIARSSVDFPEPLSPISTTESPASISRSMWRSTGTSS